jgi:hypothetical protein
MMPEVSKRLSYHSHHFGLHFAHAREDVWMNGICYSELAKGLCLQPDQFLATMVHSSADSAIFPLGMLHVGQVAQLLAYLLFTPSRAGQAGDADHARTAGYKFALELQDRFGNLGLHFCADTRQAEEDTVEIAADADVEVTEGAEDATALELVEEFARPSQKEEDEYNVLDSMGRVSLEGLGGRLWLHGRIHLDVEGD